MIEKVGEFSPAVTELLNLDIKTGTEILLSASTLDHIKKRHPDIEGDHKAIIADVIAAPDGVSAREKDSSIGFFKSYGDGVRYYLQLSVRPSAQNEYFVRTLHRIEPGRVEKRTKKGKIQLLTNAPKGGTLESGIHIAEDGTGDRRPPLAR